MWIWQMAVETATLFWQDRLFADRAHVCRLMALCAVVVAGLVLFLGSLGLHAWSASLIAGALGGAAGPLLFKNQKFK